MSVPPACADEGGSVGGSYVLFEDDFGPESRGVRQRNTVSDPPPEGMGYPTSTHYGYAPKNWIVADVEAIGPRRGFWCVPESPDGEPNEVLEQAGRSRNSICYARTIIPRGVDRFTIEFRQRANDNDYIAFVIGATQPLIRHDGIEFGYERQKPGTDETTPDAYSRGDFGTGQRLEGMAKMRRWASHRIEVDGRHVRWLQDGELVQKGDADRDLSGGYFGIRQSYERGTRYDDFRITTPVRPQVSSPNVLFITIDDLRHDLGCYGNEQIVSPNLDRFAEQSVRFDRAYCQYPLCNPSRASLMTGLRPDANGMNRDETQNRYHFRSKIPRAETLPQRFQRAGYRVGRVGKVYHYGVPREIGTESLLDDRASWQFAFYPRGGERDEESDLISYTPSRSPGWALSWQESSTPASQHTDALVADEAIRLLESFGDDPFFLAVGFYRPHVPSTAPPEAFEPYPLEEIQPAANTEHDPTVAADNPIMRVDGATEEDLCRFKRAYYATITFVDQQVGRLLDALDAQGHRDDTVVVLLSDHGWMLGEHGLWMKPYLFEECARTPMMIRAPDKARGPCSRIVEFVDVYPTVLDLCGLRPENDLHGVSLEPLLDDPFAEWSRPAYTQTRSRHATGYSVRTERWRYTEWDGATEGRELYDHAHDPQEMTNLANADDHRDTVRELSEMISRYRETSAVAPDNALQDTGPRKVRGPATAVAP